MEIFFAGQSVLIEPVKEELRKGWFDGYHAGDDKIGRRKVAYYCTA